MMAQRAAPTGTPIPPHVRAVGYVRVSTERQAGEHQTSLADQRAGIVAKAALLGVAVGAWYEDEGISGATSEARPAFTRLLADCRASRRTPKAPGYVVALNDSRFGRFPDPDQATHLRVEFKQAGWHVVFAEADDSTDPMFRPVMRTIAAVQASEYRRTIQRNAKRGAIGTTGQGFWTTSAPLGYRRKVVYPTDRARVLDHGVRKAIDEKVKLVPGPDAEVALVRWCFATYAAGRAEGASLGALARAAARRWPERQWSIPSLRHLLKNPAYVGDVVSGRRPGDKEERKEHRIRPPEQWYGKPDAHEPLVSRELYAAVQARLAENARAKRGARGAYPLSGLLRCAVCGAGMVGGGTRGAARPGTQFYRCSRAVQEHATPSLEVRCPGSLGAVTRRVVERVVFDLLTREVARPVTRRQIAATIDRKIAALADASLPARAAKRAEDAVTRLEARRARLVAAIADGTLTKAEAGPELDGIRRELAFALAERDRAAGVAESAATAADRLQALKATLLADAAAFPRVVARLAAKATGADAGTGAGANLRAALAPWIARATFDKRTRVVTVEVRRLPEVPGAAGITDPDGTATVSGMVSSGRAAPAAHEHVEGVAREVAPKHAGRRGGAA